MSKKMKKNYLICLIAVAIGFLLLCLLFDTGILGKKSAYFNGLVVIGMFYTIIVCSLNLLTGYMGEFSLGHAGFMSIGAYASAIVTTLIQDQTDLPAVLLYLIAIIVGGLAAGLIVFFIIFLLMSLFFGIIGLAGWVLSYIWPVLLILMIFWMFKGPGR